MQTLSRRQWTGGKRQVILLEKFQIISVDTLLSRRRSSIPLSPNMRTLECGLDLVTHIPRLEYVKGKSNFSEEMADTPLIKWSHLTSQRCHKYPVTLTWCNEKYLRPLWCSFQNFRQIMARTSDKPKFKIPD